jgi:hypothetical protein
VELIERLALNGSKHTSIFDRHPKDTIAACMILCKCFYSVLLIEANIISIEYDLKYTFKHK